MPLKLIQRGDTWHITGTEFGETVRRSTGTADRKKAQAILAKVRAEIFKRHTYGAQATCTFLNAAKSYLAAGKGGKDPRFLNRLLYKDRALTELTALAQTVLRDINQGFLDKLVEQCPGAESATILRNIYSPIRAVLTHASKRDLCAPPKFDCPAPGGGRTRWIKPEEAERALAVCAEHERALVTFMIGTGCRASEALFIDWREVDLDGGYAVIMGPTEEDDRDYQTKNGKVRTIALSLRVLAELRKLPHRQGPVFRKANGEPYKRPNEKGRGGDLHVVNDMFGREGRGGGIAKRAGLPHINPHMTRHTFATWHSKMDTHPLKLMVLGGWSSLDLVQRYSHMEGRLSAADARIIATWLCGLEEQPSRAPALKVVGE